MTEQFSEQDELDRKIALIEARTGRGITRESIESFYASYDLEAVKGEVRSEYSYEVLDPEQGKKYDEEIATYSFLIARNGQNIVFQPHSFSGDGIVQFGDAEAAEACAKEMIESYVDSEALYRRDIDFTRTLE